MLARNFTLSKFSKQAKKLAFMTQRSQNWITWCLEWFSKKLYQPMKKEKRLKRLRRSKPELENQLSSLNFLTRLGIELLKHLSKDLIKKKAIQKFRFKAKTLRRLLKFLEFHRSNIMIWNRIELRITYSILIICSTQKEILEFILFTLM